MHRFLVSLFISVLHVSGFLLVHLQRKLDSGSSLLALVSVDVRAVAMNKSLPPQYVQKRETQNKRKGQELLLTIRITTENYPKNGSTIGTKLHGVTVKLQ
jgi:hypothetical protein